MAGEKLTEVLARQLALSKLSWQTLQEHGVTEHSELRLDFFYVAAGEDQAAALRQFIEAETDYDVVVRSSGGRLDRQANWTVTGTTEPTRVSPGVLDKWVEWMVAVGFERGCEFDGWGAAAE